MLKRRRVDCGPREFCRTWPNQETVSVKGYHFLQEEAPDAFGDALARFVAKIRAGALG
jgi:haloalkane dehalogenase